MSTVLFVGPSLAGATLAALPATVERRPPAAMGDVWRAVEAGAGTIGLVDGVFGSVPAVWHKEILWALSRGVRVLGASSMGALRAAELHAFGMEGVGWIFESYRDGDLEDDDEVALAHAPAEAGHAPLSLPMVNVRRSLAAARDAGRLPPAAAEAVLAEIKALHYPRRGWDRLAGALRHQLGDPAAATALDWLRRHWIDQKRLDALALLDRLDRPAPAPAPSFGFSRTQPWLRLVEELRRVTPAPPEQEEKQMSTRTAGRPTGAGRKPWSLLTYIAADNNLAQAVRADIVEMASVGATDRVGVACEIDLPAGAPAGRLVLVPAMTMPAEPLSLLEPRHAVTLDAGDPVSLASFVAWGAGRCPAEALMLVVWGHGQGMRVAIDDGSKDALTLPEITGALVTAGVPRRHNVQIIAFDACLMGTIENLFQLWGRVPVMIASQEVLPDTGFAYAEVIRALDATDAGTAERAATIVDAVAARFEPRPGDRQCRTIAALDSARAEVVIRALDGFGARLLALLPARRPAIAAARVSLRTFRSGESVDLVDMAGRLAQALADAELTGLADELAALAQAAVIRQHAIRSIAADGTILADPRVHGLSIWFPSQRNRYLASRSDYLMLRCFGGAEHGWVRFLDQLHQAPADLAIPPVI